MSTEAGTRASVINRPIRVLVVTARFLPDLGGIETHINELCSRMGRNKLFQITVLATDRSGRLPIREDFEGFTVLRCRSYPRHRDYYFAPYLHGLVLRGGYDLVHCQGIHTAVPIIAMLAAKRGRIPYVVTFHTGGHSSGLRNRLRRHHWRLLAPLLRDSAALIAVSRFEQQIFEKACRLDQARFRLLQNGGTLPITSVRASPIQGRIVSSGRLERYKGHHRIIEALPIVHRTIPDATLHILGSGPYEDKLRALVSAQGLEEWVTIEHIAPSDRERMARSLGQAAVFAALSEYEAHSVAIMEALTLGIPTIGLNSAGIADLVEDGLVIGVPKDASPAKIAGALVEALALRGVGISATLPTWDTATSSLGRIYMDVVGAKSRHTRSYEPT
jgi:glycosyltransferase involved in cell wall biosynthesis